MMIPERKTGTTFLTTQMVTDNCQILADSSMKTHEWTVRTSQLTLYRMDY